MSKKIYFASDFHLGLDADKTSLERERLIVDWLEEISSDAKAIYLVGDVFDFWYEYNAVIPKGYNRLFGKLAELRDRDIPIYFFTGNHDMWMFRYFEEEFGIPIYRKPIIEEFFGRKYMIGHGDGLGPGDHGYKFIKRIFSNGMCQWLFALVHPNIGVWLMKYFSQRSRKSSRDEIYHGADKEWLIQYGERKLKEEDIDVFVFGHRHLPIQHRLSDGKSIYINLGDWIKYYSYAVLDEEGITLKYLNDANQVTYGNIADTTDKL